MAATLPKVPQPRQAPRSGSAYLCDEARGRSGPSSATPSPLRPRTAPRDAIACRSPVEMSASAWRCGTILAQRHAVHARGADWPPAAGPGVTANTPDFGRGCRSLRRAIAGREHERVRGRAQFVVDCERSRVRRRRVPTAASHGCAAAEVAHTMRSTAMRRPCVTTMVPGSTAIAPLERCSTTPRSTRMRPKTRAHDRRRAAEGWTARSRDQREARRIRAQRRLQPVLHREQEFDAARAAADYARSCVRCRLTRIRLHPAPCGEKRRDRLDRSAMLGGAGDAQVRRRTDVERDEVERLAVAGMRASAVFVYRSSATTRSATKRAPAHSASGSEVDVRFAPACSGRRPGRAACPSSTATASGRDERERDPRVAAQREPAQHLDVRCDRRRPADTRCGRDVIRP